ncbi:MAG TPA: ABC transporter substrate-binding protein [Deltaproteobacteria bacterium]|nr:ABC transporter substrate-binding protein [Deltaproteobacteria bacterium]
MKNTGSFPRSLLRSGGPEVRPVSCAMRAVFQWAALLVPALSVLIAAAGCTEGEDGARLLRFVSWKPNQPEVWDEAIALFERENPGVRVVREIAPHSSTVYHDLLAQKLKNRDPSVDVFLMDVVWPHEFASAGWALRLDEFFTPDRRAPFFEAAVEADTYRGGIYGVPLYISGGLLYYRKDLLRRYGFEPPRTWPELVRQAEAIRAGEKDPDLYGYSAQFKQYEGLVCNMQEIILSGGARLFDAASGRTFLSAPRAVEAVRFARDELVGRAAPRGVLAYQEPESLDLFIQGGAVFHRNWPYAWEAANNPARSKVAGKVGVAPLPAFEDGGAVAALGGWHMAVSSFSRNVELAWRFVEFMTGERMQKFFALRAGVPPARRSLYADPEVLERNPHFAALREVFENASPRPRTPYYTALSHILQKYFSSALSDRRSDIASLARRADEETAALAARYGYGGNSAGASFSGSFPP